LLERLFPEHAEYVGCGCAVLAEGLPCAGERSCFVLVIHSCLLLEQYLAVRNRDVARGGGAAAGLRAICDGVILILAGGLGLLLPMPTAHSRCCGTY
jgi:hypothetical protein